MVKVIGLCGGSGSGKGVVSRFFGGKGIPVFDCDVEYHALISAPGSCVEEISSAFGSEILTPQGGIGRPKLANLVFSPAEGGKKRLEELNRISHKYVSQAFFAWCDTCEKQGSNVVLLDAPLLFESGLDRICAVTVAVVAPLEVRIQRIMKRDGITADAARRRVVNQIGDDVLRQRCDITLENAGDEAQLVSILSDLYENLNIRGILS